MLMRLPRQYKSRRGIGHLQTVEPISHLELGLLQRALLPHLLLLLGIDPLVVVGQQGVAQSLALHGHQNAQGGGMLAHAACRTGALGSPCLQVASFGHAHMGSHAVRLLQRAEHLGFGPPVIAIGAHLRRQDLVFEVQRGAFGPRIGVKVKGQL